MGSFNIHSSQQSNAATTRQITYLGVLKMKFYITETLSYQSRPFEEIIEAKDLTQAKRMASYLQCFQGTTMKIYAENKTTLLAVKQKGKWKSK